MNGSERIRNRKKIRAMNANFTLRKLKKLMKIYIASCFTRHVDVSLHVTSTSIVFIYATSFKSTTTAYT